MPRTIRSAIAAGLVALTAGCSTVPRATDVVTGLGAGVAGGLVCALVGGSAKTCAAIAAGVAVAVTAGKVLHREMVRDPYEEAEYRGYVPSAGIQALTDSGSATPAQVEPGGTLQVTVGRSVLTPDFRAAVSVREVWELWDENSHELLAEIARDEGMAEPGYFTITREFTIPEADPGCYRIAYWVEAEGVPSNKTFVPFRVGQGGACTATS